MRKIKILFTIPNFDTAGSGKHMVDLIRNLDLDRFEPSICCDHDRGAYYNFVKSLGYPIYLRELSPNRDNYLKGIKTAINNARFLKEQGFDLIHSFHWKSDWYEPLAAKIAHIPWVYTKKSMVWNKHWRIRTMLSSFVFTLNPEMITLYPIPKKTARCVGLGPNVDEVLERCSQFDRPSTKKSLGVSDKTILLSVANLVPVKNIDFLVRAVSRLPNREKYHLFVVGDYETDYGYQLKQFVEDNNLNDTITFTGKVLDVEKYLSIADLYIQPTSQHGRSEASGVACMEACAAGVASIGSDVAGLRFVLGEKSLLFEPDNEDALLEAIQRIRSFPESEFKETGALLQDRMRRLFHIPNVAKDHEEVYFTLAKMK